MHLSYTMRVTKVQAFILFALGTCSAECSKRFAEKPLAVSMNKVAFIELARKATELDPDMKVMFITGFAAVALNSENKPKDAKVLSKPFHLRDLVNEVERLLKAA